MNKKRKLNQITKSDSVDGFSTPSNKAQPSMKRLKISTDSDAIKKQQSTPILSVPSSSVQKDSPSPLVKKSSAKSGSAKSGSKAEESKIGTADR